MEAQGMAGDPERPARLLRAMHKVLSHDLPNHLVVVQSLIQLLEVEERDHLGTQGREYLTRLIGAAQRTQMLSKYLKDLDRLQGLTETQDLIHLPTLLEEIQVDLAAASTPCQITWKMSSQPPNWRLGRRTFQRCMTELIRLAVDLGSVDRLVVEVETGATASGIFALTLRCVAPLPTQAFLPHNRTNLEQRLEYLLARELAATWTGELQASLSEGAILFHLTIPSIHA